MNYPKTLEEARLYKYGCWAGNPRSLQYVEGRCACEVAYRGGWRWCQCSRHNGHGPGGLYCKQHAKQLQKRGCQK